MKRGCVFVTVPRDCARCGKPLELPRAAQQLLHPVCRDAIKAARYRSRSSLGQSRPKTLALKVLQEIAVKDLGEDLERRPKTRGGCADVARPCPFVSCVHHLYLDVNPETGSIKLEFPDREVWELDETCSLDVADRGGATLEEVGDLLNLVRERVRQVEAKALLKLRREAVR